MDDRELDAALDDLLAQPPEQFVGARKTLVRALKSAGRKEEAATVGGWRRPTRTTWALNRLAQVHHDDVVALVDAAGAVRREQVAGGAGLRGAMADLRKATRQAADAAVAAIAPARPADHADVSAALLAVLSDADALAELAKGRLLDIPESGLGAFESGPAEATDLGHSGTKSASNPAKSVDRAALREAQQAVHAAREHQAEADAAAAEAERASGAARQRLDDLQAEVEKAETAVSAATEAMNDTETTAAEAAAEVSRAEEALARLERPQA